MKTFHNAKKKEVDWIVFDSKLEADYYLYLKWNKDVVDIKTQPVYMLQPAVKSKWLQKITYVLDFEVTYKDWHIDLVDIKGMPTEVSKLKRKMFIYQYDKPLLWLCKFKWEWVDYFDNRKRILKNKKLKNEEMDLW